ncbi:hypothetical protein AB4Z22_37020, partial [Paenibacillus sp. TAF58]
VLDSSSLTKFGKLGILESTLAANASANPSKQLFRVKWFCYIILAPQVKSIHNIRRVAAGS